MNKQKHPISLWLDESIYNKVDPPIYNLIHRNLSTYYLDNDKNLNINNEFKIKEMKNLNRKINSSYNYDDIIEDKSYDELEYDKDLIKDSNYVQVFRSNEEKFIQYIDQDTRRYHVNMLFNKLVDFCYKKEITGFKGELLINKKMRSKFVKFCYENSK